MPPADALDVAEFARADKKGPITVRHNRPTRSSTARAPPEAAFLQEVRSGACSVFDAVMGLTSTPCTWITCTWKSAAG